MHSCPRSHTQLQLQRAAGWSFFFSRFFVLSMICTLFFGYLWWLYPPAQSTLDRTPCTRSYNVERESVKLLRGINYSVLLFLSPTSDWYSFSSEGSICDVFLTFLYSSGVNADNSAVGSHPAPTKLKWWLIWYWEGVLRGGGLGWLGSELRAAYLSFFFGISLYVYCGRLSFH